MKDKINNHPLILRKHAMVVEWMDVYFYNGDIVCMDWWYRVFGFCWGYNIIVDGIVLGLNYMKSKVIFVGN